MIHKLCAILVRVSSQQARKVEVRSVDFNHAFVARMIARLDWGALRMAADSVSIYLPRL